MADINSTKAFTIIELTISILIAGILAILSMPSLSSYAKSNKLRTESQKIARLIENLSSKAHYNNQDVLLIFLPNEYRAKYAATGKPITTRSIPKGVSITTLNRSQLTFYKSNVATPASIKVSDDDSFCLIQISLRSRVNINCGR